MVKRICLSLALVLAANVYSFAQCAMCTKTAAGLNDKSAEALNNGIIYLAFIPLILMCTVGLVWYRYQKGKL
jgi:hypothetical protein